MSSVLSSYPGIPQPPTKFFDILTGSYEENIIVPTDFLPIPFVVNNQVLDINVNQSADVQTFVNNGTAPDNIITYQGKVMGGASLIKSFGPNMTTYLRNLINNIESLGSAYTGPLVLYVRPFMTKIQIAQPAFGQEPLNDEAVYGVTTEAPTQTEYIGGSSESNFLTAWVFKTPMTIQYVAPAGNYKYITMTTQFSAN
jgi:hypothetical protein